MPVPAKAQLGFPGKLPGVENRVPDERVDDVARVDVNDDEAVHLLAVVFGQIAAYHVGEVNELAAQLVGEVFHGHLVTLAHTLEDVLNLPGPPNLRPGKCDHAQLILYPLVPAFFRVVEHALLGD